MVHLETNKIIILCLLAVFILLLENVNSSSIELKSVPYISQHQQSKLIALDLQKLIDRITLAQPEVIQRLVRDYLSSQAKTLNRNRVADQLTIKCNIREMFKNSTTINALQYKVQKFMKEKLFHQLELDTMVDDYQKEVNKSPKDYYITPEMYDLLNQ